MLKNFCGSPDHAIVARGFLGAAAAGAAAFADMTALDVLDEPGPGRRAEEAAEARHPALAGRRREPAGNLGPQAGRRRPAGRSAPSRPPCPASTSPS